MDNENTNPHDNDLGSLDTSFPLISGPQKLALKVEKAEVVAGTKNTDARMLSLELSTTEPTLDINGETLAPGARVFHRENIVCVGKLKPDQIRRGVASIVQAAGIPSLRDYGQTADEQVANAAQWAPLLKDKILTCNVILEPAKNGYKARNSIGEFVKATV